MLEAIIACGLLIVAIGVGLIYLPAGVIVAGIEIAAGAVAYDLLQPDEAET